jgi:hypothetical protein
VRAAREGEIVVGPDEIDGLVGVLRAGVGEDADVVPVASLGEPVDRVDDGVLEPV